MKIQKIVCSMAIALFVLTGCGGGGSSGSSSSFSTEGTAPVADNIEVEDPTTGEKLIIPIDGKDITISLKENTRDAFKLKATDKTNLTYYLTGTDIKYLGIDPKTGFVFFHKPTDYESRHKYEITVGVKDSVNNETEQKVIINIKNIENEPAAIVPIDLNSGLAEDEEKYFITTWKTDNPGISNDNQIIIPTVGDGYNYSVDWGDKTSSKNLTLDAKHTYSKAGTYKVKITGKFPRIYFAQNSDYELTTYENDSRKILSIDQWGTNVWESMGGAFSECVNLKGKASDKPILSKVTDLSLMFYMTPFNQNIGDWDTSNITNMAGMFAGNPYFDQNISEWDTSNVTDMYIMFALTTSFNQDITGWDTSKVLDTRSMFWNAKAFNQDISSWDVSNVTSMYAMFSHATSFNQNLENWSLSEEGAYIGELFTGADAMSKLPSWYSVDYDIKTRSFIVLVDNLDPSFCTVSKMTENIRGKVFLDNLTFTNNIDTNTLIVSLKNDYVYCTTDYGRNEDEQCKSIDFQVIASECVVGFNFEK